MVSSEWKGVDLKDRKILYELDLDARQSLSSVGKKVGLSKEVVNYRINRMLEKGVIKDFYARIDFSKVGLLVFRTFLRLHNTTPEKEKEIIDYFVSSDHVGWCINTQGNWDINFIFWARDNNHFFSFWKDYKKKYGAYLANSWVSLYGWFINLPKGFLLGKKPDGYEPFYMGSNEKVQLDKLDLSILTILAENARKPLIEIARETGAGEKVVAYRIKKMEKEQVIGSYGVRIDLSKIGYEYWKMHLRFGNYNEKRFNELNGYCIEHPNIVYTNELIGGADFEIEGFFRNYDELQVFMQKIRHMFNDIIRDFEILLYYNEYKLNLFPYPKNFRTL